MKFITLDIGGEGRHPEAWNINPCRVKTFGPERGAPIARLILARAERLPFATGSVDRVIVERTPLGDAAIREIARVIRPGGEVLLRHVPLPTSDRHHRAQQILAAPFTQTRAYIGGQEVLQTKFRLPEGVEIRWRRQVVIFTPAGCRSRRDGRFW